MLCTSSYFPQPTLTMPHYSTQQFYGASLPFLVSSSSLAPATILPRPHSGSVTSNRPTSPAITYSNNLLISLLADFIAMKASCILNLPIISLNSFVNSPLPLLRDFIIQLVLASQSLPITLLIVLVLLTRLRHSLPRQATGTFETSHRLFLAAIILANKFILDIPMKNSVWSQWTKHYYSNVDINCMERQFLNLLNHDIDVSCQEIQHQWEHFQRFSQESFATRHSPQLPCICPTQVEKKRSHCSTCPESHYLLNNLYRLPPTKKPKQNESHLILSPTLSIERSPIQHPIRIQNLHPTRPISFV